MTVWLAMALYSLSMSISPGPVNLLAMTNGLNYGFGRSFSYVSGATIGFISLFFLTGLSVSFISELMPNVMKLTGIIGALFVGYIGWQIVKTSEVTHNHDPKNSATFLEGALLQWLNPKAWIASIAGMSAFQVENTDTLTVFSSIYFVICYLSIACWAFLGEKLQSVLNEPSKIHRFNQAMGSALILIAGYLLFRLALEWLITTD
ncbi:LysE family translocator [Litoribrevibacter albus]|uniref:LysE family translocator n=1 Tax=Litoribrevibacter albus TaxID=1473156 RepID=A0AA37SBY5_9GAMM|nr:LysE family translocator [Litoribrevibacter albus]GLQ31757.1 hypothetical protein GCM10007876_22360 [Litoribrevibacter albus]